ncbi:hypothetical protein EW145_g1030 [Phellinidium pouzarii]|uniref:ThuA-like domain-containing protein n=1 Tax=Phellinidium pouzarii TaxID=167371 RepID=A0A4S4LGL0_9AGAM|nr:hypothetical protein EW145_g1030 [Phellinidium pouzarii]
MFVSALRTLLAVAISLAHARTCTAQQRFTASILLYTATADFRHDSIPTSIDALRNQSTSGTYDVRFDSTEDMSNFSDDNLANYDAIMFVSTTGEVLDDSGKTAFHNFLDKGGNFIAVHAASDSLRNTLWYSEEVGAFFDYHPFLQNATVDVIDSSHPSTNMLPAQWHVQDEISKELADIRPFDPVSSPEAWFQEHGAGVDSGNTAGRSFYTSLGHLNETWRDDLFLAHVMGGVMWTLQANTTKAFNASGLVGNSASVSGSSSGSFGPGSATESAGASPTTSTSGDLSFYRLTPTSTSILAVIGAATLAYIGFAV